MSATLSWKEEGGKETLYTQVNGEGGFRKGSRKKTPLLVILSDWTWHADIYNDLLKAQADTDPFYFTVKREVHAKEGRGLTESFPIRRCMGDDPTSSTHTIHVAVVRSLEALKAKLIEELHMREPVQQVDVDF